MFDDVWFDYFPIPNSKNEEHPIARRIVGVPKPDSLDESSVAAEHLERISDELFKEDCEP